jgi:hypothetical protein
MKRLEIIHLRSSGRSLESLGERIRDSIRAGTEGNAVVTLYRRHELETDLSVHVCHHGEPQEPGPSDLALKLAAALRAYGLVEHTVWEELP